jgi:hypothetical protein
MGTTRPRGTGRRASRTASDLPDWLQSNEAHLLIAVESGHHPDGSLNLSTPLLRGFLGSFMREVLGQVC